MKIIWVGMILASLAKSACGGQASGAPTTLDSEPARALVSINSTPAKATQIPADQLKSMSSEALLAACLDNAKPWLLLADSDLSRNSAFKNGLFRGYNGIAELASRTDAGAAALAFFQKSGQTVDLGNPNEETRFRFACWLLLERDEFTTLYSAQQKEQLALVCLRNLHYQDKTKGQFSPGIAQAELGFLIRNQVVIHHNGATVDKSQLPASLAFLTKEDFTGPIDGRWTKDLIAFIGERLL